MEITAGRFWEETAAELTKEFMAWGCRFSREKLPEIALGYDCTELFFWNWMDGGAARTETGFLRVLGYAWRKRLREAGDEAPAARAERGAVPESRAA